MRRSMRRGWWSAGWAVVALGCAGSDAADALPVDFSSYVAPAEYWKFTFDGREWNAVSKVRDKTSATEIYVPPGQDAKNWTEMVTTTLTFGAHRKTTVGAVAEATKKMLEKDCPSFQWMILEQSAQTVMYEWSRQICKDVQPQHELVRLSEGRLGIHKLGYAARSPNMAGGLRQRWIALLKRAKLQVRNPEESSGASSSGAAVPAPR